MTNPDKVDDSQSDEVADTTLQTVRFKLLAVEVGPNLEVKIPTGTVPLNAMYNPETLKLCVMVLNPYEISVQPEPEQETEEETGTTADAVDDKSENA